jgi:predicted nucleic acid-binding protein
MSGLFFVDSNVLIYRLDASEAVKQPLAARWLQRLWTTGAGRLSNQVLHEFYQTVTRRLRPGLQRDEARDEVRDLEAWRPVRIDQGILEQAWRIEDRFGLSFWDSLIVAAAHAASCTHLLSEDLQDGQDLNGVQVVNPFEHPPDELGL